MCGERIAGFLKLWGTLRALRAGDHLDLYAITRVEIYNLAGAVGFALKAGGMLPNLDEHSSRCLRWSFESFEILHDNLAFDVMAGYQTYPSPEAIK